MSKSVRNSGVVRSVKDDLGVFEACAMDSVMLHQIFDMPVTDSWEERTVKHLKEEEGDSYKFSVEKVLNKRER